MSTNQSKTVVQGIEEVNETFKKRVGKFLIFPIAWWEKVNTEHIANDIVIETPRPIRKILINGREINF